MSDFIYDAFISYSHRDLTWGKWLQHRLETFRIPKDVLGGRQPGQRLKVFRDQTDLAGVELTASLRRELEVSQYLIVLCSPASAASSWVNDEVTYFISLGRIDRIIPFIVEGEPLSEDPALECYPEGLRTVENFTLLGANVQEIGKSKAFLKLVSILLDVRFNRLVDREKQRKIRTALIAGSVSAVILISGTALLWRNAVISRRNHELSYDIYGAAMVSIAEKDVIEPADVEFLRVSAEEGNTQAILLLADCYKNGWGTEADPEQLFYWSKIGAETGDPECMVLLANCYQNGEGTAADPEQTFYWDRKAAEAGSPGGMLDTGICYEDGIGTEADPEEAFYWYGKSAEAGYDLAMYNYARCYVSGMGTPQNPEKAFEWMQKLAETGNAFGLYNMGLMCQNGLGTEEDPQAAYEWYRKAAEAGDADGAYMTGWCIENHYGTDDQALEWYKRAAALGSEAAEEAVARLEG